MTQTETGQAEEQAAFLARVQAYVGREAKPATAAGDHLNAKA